ncbi:MAG: type II toxin-antitoxin system VapC family toxin [Candidatus Bathyarchaeia archaeon]
MERAAEIVLDASVVVKWFSEEEDSDIALKVRSEHIDGLTTLVSPDLMLYEVVNALRYNPGFNSDDVKRAASDLIDLEMDLITPSNELFENAAKHAYRYDLTIYDACYLSLAEHMGLEALTADERLYEKTRESGLIKLLKDY